MGDKPAGRAGGARGKPLGRGLAALLGDLQDTSPQSIRAMPVAVDRLIRSPAQPRHTFAEEGLAELAASIRAHGVIQPLLVRDVTADGEPDLFEIVAGERRWRAAQLAGLDEVPVIVRAVSDQEALAIALVENLQRQDLSAIEEAEAFRRLLEDFALTQDGVAELVGKSRPQISNTLRLLRLPPSVRASVDSGQLSAGHARALVSAADPEGLAERIIREGLTVRDAERLARSPEAAHVERQPAKALRDPNIVAVEQDLSAALGLTASLKVKDEKRGALVLHYRSLEQLDGLLALLHGRMN